MSFLMDAFLVLLCFGLVVALLVLDMVMTLQEEVRRDD